MGRGAWWAIVQRVAKTEHSHYSTLNNSIACKQYLSSINFFKKLKSYNAIAKLFNFPELMKIKIYHGKH